MTGDKPIQIMGAGLSGLAAATILAKAGKEVHVHDIRGDSGARFDGDFQALENQKYRIASPSRSPGGGTQGPS